MEHAQLAVLAGFFPLHPSRKHANLNSCEVDDATYGELGLFTIYKQELKTVVGAFDNINGSRLSLKCINVTNKNVKNGVKAYYCYQ